MLLEKFRVEVGRCRLLKSVSVIGYFLKSVRFFGFGW